METQPALDSFMVACLFPNNRITPVRSTLWRLAGRALLGKAHTGRLMTNSCRPWNRGTHSLVSG